MFCSNCGAPLVAGAAFCQECGAAVPQRAQAATPVQPAPQQPAAGAPVQRKPKHSRGKRFLIVAGALFGLLVLCGILGSLVDPEPDEQAVATTPVPAGAVSVAPEITTAPTGVPEPTAPATDAPTVTLVIPTIAPIPTVLPTVPVESVAPDVAAYLEKASTPIQQYGTWLQRIGELSTEAGNTPSLFFDDDWKVRMTTALVALRLAGESLGTLSPVPEQAKPVDDLLKKIAVETEPMADEYLRGLDGMNVALITSAGERMGRIAGWITELGPEMEKLTT